MKGIIPTGGRGTRMQPMSLYTNKHFIPVGNKPLIYYPIEALSGAGIKEIAVTYNPGGLELSKSYLGDGSKWGVKFTYIEQKEPKGVADIIRVCEEYLDGESFAFHLGDNIFTEGIKEAVEHFNKEKPDGMVLMVHHPENWRLGVPYFDDNGRLVKYAEKPKNPPHDFAIPGLYFANSNIFKCFKGKDAIKPSERGEYEISSPFQWLIDQGYRVDVQEYKEKWLDPGKFDDWIDSNEFLLDKNIESKINSKLDNTVKIKNRVFIGKDCSISNSEIRGPVSILDNVTITDAYIGPYTSIGKGCVIQSAKVENCVLMDEVTISHITQQIDNSLIGVGSEISGNGGNKNCYEFFIGEKASIKL